MRVHPGYPAAGAAIVLGPFACGDRKLSALATGEGDKILAGMGRMMPEQKEPAAMIGSIRSAAQNADILLPQLEIVMAADPDERMKMVALHGTPASACLATAAGSVFLNELRITLRT